MFSSFLRTKSHLRSIPFQAFAPFSSGQQLRIFRSKSHSIYWNLATEEYFFEHANLETPTLFLYREDKTIIIGIPFISMTDPKLRETSKSLERVFPSTNEKG
jgi:hypothetical protein